MNAAPSKNEEIKEASRFLRGGIAEGLARVETGAIAEDDAQLTKFHGTYLQDDRDLRPERRKKKLEQAYMFMVRVRVPGGVCTPTQWLAMDQIATDYGNGTLRLTTRQAFQFHGVIKSNLKRSMQARKTASRGVKPSRWATTAKSTSMIAFFCTRPMTMTTPMKPTRENCICAASRPRSAPMLAAGTVDRMVMGWI